MTPAAWRVSTRAAARAVRRLAASLWVAVAATGAWAAAPDSGAALPSEEVPFITTPEHVTLAMLELAGVGPKDHVLDLGSGDGRIVITAARRFGASGMGVDLVPDLVAQSRENARRAGVAARTRFEVQDLFATDLTPATVITMYLLPEVNLALRPRLLALAPGTRIVSHDWDLGDWTPDRTLTLPVPTKSVGLEKSSRLHLWTVPAAVQGLWCGPQGSSLRIEQRYQMLQAQLRSGRSQQAHVGRAHGAELRLLGEAGSSWSAVVEGDQIRIGDGLRDGTGGWPPGTRLRRGDAKGCN